MSTSASRMQPSGAGGGGGGSGGCGGGAGGGGGGSGDGASHRDAAYAKFLVRPCAGFATPAEVKSEKKIQ